MVVIVLVLLRVLRLEKSHVTVTMLLLAFVVGVEEAAVRSAVLAGAEPARVLVGAAVRTAIQVGGRSGYDGSVAARAIVVTPADAPIPQLLLHHVHIPIFFMCASRKEASWRAMPLIQTTIPCSSLLQNGRLILQVINLMSP